MSVWFLLLFIWWTLCCVARYLDSVGIILNNSSFVLIYFFKLWKQMMWQRRLLSENKNMTITLVVCLLSVPYTSWWIYVILISVCDYRPAEGLSVYCDEASLWLLVVTHGSIFGSKHLSVAQIGLRCSTAASPPGSPLTCLCIRLH